MIGKVVGHYKILRRVGTGGMGEVYAALDTRLDRTVALKLLPAEDSTQPGSRARFIREAKAVASLQHPNIVTLYSVEDVDGHLFLTMELVEGTTLDQVLPPGGLSQKKFFKLAKQLSGALHAAHGKGITHRDLKPANVMVDAAGDVKVLDFGLAKLLHAKTSMLDETVEVDAATEKGVVLGTVAYMSPEQAEGRAVDHRSDIFSFGILLYEMSTGRRPFTGEGKISILSSILRDVPQPVHELNRSLSPELGRLIGQCLNKEPDRRYQDALDIQNELDRLASGVISDSASDSVSVQSPAPPAPPTSEVGAVKSRPSWVWVALGAAALAVAAYFLAGPLGLPFGRSSSLVSAGILEVRDKVLIAAFENHTDNEALADAVGEALAIDFSQSPTFNAVSRSQVAQTLKRMEVALDTPLESKLAREVATREGIKVVVEGSVRSLGEQTVVSARLVRVEDGEVLTAVQRTANSDQEVLQAVGEVSRELRKKIGESIFSIRGTPALHEVTTSSLLALQKYTQAASAAEEQNDDARAIELLEDAVTIDSTFAMAWRKLGILLGNNDIEYSRQIDAYTKAYNLRDKLTERERLHTVASYEVNVNDNTRAAITAYESILATHPDDYIALNNLGLYYQFVREPRRSLEILNHALALQPTISLYQNKASAFIQLNEEDSVKAVVDAMKAAYSESPFPELVDVYYLSAFNHYEEARLEGLEVEKLVGGNLFLKLDTVELMGSINLAMGNIVDAERRWQVAEGLQVSQAETGRALEAAMGAPFMYVEVLQDRETALALMERALDKYPLESMTAVERPYTDLVDFYAVAGEVEIAEEYLREYQEVLGSLIDQTELHEAQGSIAYAKGDLDTAYREFSLQRFVKSGWIDPRMAEILADQGRDEEALAILEGFLDTRFFWKVHIDAVSRPRYLVKTAQLNEKLGNYDKALHYYGLLQDMWIRPDARLQPQLDFIEERMAALAAERSGS